MNIVSLPRDVHDKDRVDVLDFKRSMRLLAGGVVVITAGRGRHISGMTVTSFSSFAADPPSVVVSINRAASSWPLIEQYGHFGANVLTSDQVEIAERFAGRSGLKGADRFDGVPWTTLASGVPLLSGTLASLDCEVDHAVERHSHVLLIGRVRGLHIASDRSEGLAYWDRKYASIGDDDASRRLAEVSVPTSRALWEV